MKNNNTTKVRKAPSNFSCKFNDPNLTSQAGLIPVIRFLDSLSFTAMAKKQIPTQSKNNSVYELADILLMAVIAFAGGATTLYGMMAVWGDKIIQNLAGMKKIPDESHFGRLWKKFQYSTVSALEKLCHDLRNRAWGKICNRDMSYFRHLSVMWLDVDSTVVTVFGKQAGAEKGYNPEHKGRLSYHPLLAFCAHTKEILQGWLRCGSAYTSNGIIDFLSQLLPNLPKRIRYIIRGDSGFFDGGLLSFLEERECGYLIKVKMRNLVDLLVNQNWETIPGKKGWEQCRFRYTCHDWKKGRIFSAVRQEVIPKPTLQKKLWEEKEYEYFCYVTTEKYSPWECHKTYGKRATSETWIDEAKNQMGLGKVRTADFWANSALFQCAIIAYNSFKWMGICSKNDQLEKWEIKTIRTFIIRLAGKLVKSARHYTLRMPESEFYSLERGAWFQISP